MIHYKRFLTLTIVHPLLDVSKWLLLPSRATEQYLARNRLRLSFNQGVMSILGLSSENTEESLHKTQDGEMCLYLFCEDPYFQRASAFPMYAPGREFLFISIWPENDGSEHLVDVVPAKPWCLHDIDVARKKYTGIPHGVPPFGLLHLPYTAINKTCKLELHIAAREIYWAYLISPLPIAPKTISISDKFVSFIPEIRDDGLLFVSDKPLALTASGRKGVSLIIGNSGIALMEDLPSPGIDQIKWDAGTNSYRGIVPLDLRQFGVTI